MSVGCSGATLVCSLLSVVLALGLHTERLVIGLSIYCAILAAISTYLSIKIRSVSMQRVLIFVCLKLVTLLPANLFFLFDTVWRNDLTLR